VKITSHVPLSTLLHLATTSCHLRFKLLGFPSDRDAVARAWMENSGPWYLPVSADADQNVTKENAVVGWAYLWRCVDTGSMRNRRRIWKIAAQLEELADRIGV
jgi:hypothetical protein